MQIVLAVCLLGGLAAAGGRAESPSQEEMSQQRKEAAHRQRRVIFNNDGNEAVYFPDSLEPTAESILAMRTAPLADSHVDTLFYCTNRGFGMFLHQTKVGEALTWETREKKGYYADKHNIVGDLHDQGTDPLQVMTDFARRHGKEIFWSMRMNDTHDAGNSSLLPQFKKDHPEYLFGTPQKPPPFRGFSGVWGSPDGVTWGGYSGVDYGQEAVRDFAFESIKEVCENYDVDGVELDFFRSPMLFKSHAWGEQVTQEEREALTGLLRRIHRMTEEVSLRRGRPLLIAIRVPDSLEYCHSMGIDLERWLQEGLVDLFVAGGDFVLSPWEESVELGHKHGVPVYAALTNTARNSRTPEFRARSRPEGYRARAMAAWQAGADGIYIFNLFDPDAPMWRELGDPLLLQQLDKVYYGASTPLEGVTRYQPDGLRFSNLPILSPEDPETLKPGEPLARTFVVGDDVLWGKDRGIVPQLNLGLQVQDLDDANDITATINGHRSEGGELVDDWVEYQPTPERIRQGSNEIQTTFRGDREPGPVVRDLRLRVAYEGPESH